MRKALLILPVALLLGGAASAQTLEAAQVPSPVTASFRQQFPKAEAVQWQQDHSEYAVRFQEGGARESALFTPAGGLLQSATAVTEAQLPAAVRSALAQQAGGRPVQRITRNFRAETKATSYEAVVTQKGGTTSTFLFDAAGRVLKGK